MEPSTLMPESTCVVHISETGVSSSNPNGKIDTVEWQELDSVEIITTDKGPFLPATANAQIVLPRANPNNNLLQ